MPQIGNLTDMFNSDIFSEVSLTAAIEQLPMQPSMIGDMGMFVETPINTTTATVELYQGKLSIIQTQPRGTRVTENAHPKRKTRAFVVPHTPQYDTVRADEVLGLRKFGEEVPSLMTVADMLSRRIQAMKDNIDMTHEWHRVGALQGLIQDADGSTIYDLFAEFGLTRDSFQFDFATAFTTDIKTTATKLKRKMMFNLGKTKFTGITAICGDNFWDGFITCASVKEAYKNWEAALMLQTTQREGFDFAGIHWVNYTGHQPNGSDLIPTEQAQFFPTGVGQELMQSIAAPGDMMGAVGTLGQTYYLQREVMPYDLGVEMRGTSNVLQMVNRPQCLIQGTHN